MTSSQVEYSDSHTYLSGSRSLYQSTPTLKKVKTARSTVQNGIFSFNYILTEQDPHTLVITKVSLYKEASFAGRINEVTTERDSKGEIIF